MYARKVSTWNDLRKWFYSSRTKLEPLDSGVHIQRNFTAERSPIFFYDKDGACLCCKISLQDQTSTIHLGWDGSQARHTADKRMIIQSKGQ